MLTKALFLPSQELQNLSQFDRNSTFNLSINSLKMLESDFKICVAIYCDYVPIHLFLISNYSQASALKVALIFKVFGAQSCLMVA